jgi:hypothetical protein
MLEMLGLVCFFIKNPRNITTTHIRLMQATTVNRDKLSLFKRQQALNTNSQRNQELLYPFEKEINSTL